MNKQIWMRQRCLCWWAMATYCCWIQWVRLLKPNKDGCSKSAGNFKLPSGAEENVSKIQQLIFTCGTTVCAAPKTMSDFGLVDGGTVASTCHCYLILKSCFCSPPITSAAATWPNWTPRHQGGLPGEQTGPPGQLQHRFVLQTGPEWGGKTEGRPHELC